MTNEEMLLQIGKVIGDTVRASEDRLMKRMDGLEQDMVEVKDDLREVKGRLDVLEQEVRIVKEDVQNLQVDMRIVKEDVQNLQADVREVKAGVIHLNNRVGPGDARE